MFDKYVRDWKKKTGFWNTVEGNVSGSSATTANNGLVFRLYEVILEARKLGMLPSELRINCHLVKFFPEE